MNGVVYLPLTCFGVPHRMQMAFEPSSIPGKYTETIFQYSFSRLTACSQSIRTFRIQWRGFLRAVSAWLKRLWQLNVNTLLLAVLLLLVLSLRPFLRRVCHSDWYRKVNTKEISLCSTWGKKNYYSSWKGNKKDESKFSEFRKSIALVYSFSPAP